MLDLRPRLDTVADGSNQDWAINFASSSYIAVQRGTPDSQYISSNTLGHITDVVCENGPVPELGFVTGVVLRYRVRVTDLTGAPAFLLDVARSSVALSVGKTVTPTSTNWIDGEYRLEVDPSTGARWLASGLSDLGAYVEVSTASAAGELHVSELWLEVEWAQSAERYDPVSTVVTPDAITGMLAWNTTGTQAAAIAGDSLRVQDASAADWRSYDRTILEYGEDYVTEVATRLQITTATAGPAFIYRIAQVDDATHQVDLCAFLDAAQDPYIGLITTPKDHNDPTKYLVTHAIDWTESHHYRLLIDRWGDPGGSADVQVLVDYGTDPVLRVNYAEFAGISGSADIQFGSGDASLQSAQSDTYISFFDWWHYHRTGGWRYWYTTAIAGNSVVIDAVDDYIARPITVSPPGIVTGQSTRCCLLDVADIIEECSVSTYFVVPQASTLYAISVDYRIDTLATDAKLFVQRTSDHAYFNDTTNLWQAASTDITLPYSPGRTRAIDVITDLSVSSIPDKFIITIRNDTGAAGAHKVFVYKVDLRE